MLAFEKTIEYFNEISDDETLLTISDLRDVMAQHCTEPYTNKWLKKKLQERCGESIFIASICGKKDVIIESDSAAKVIQDFHSKQKVNSTNQKADLVKTAAKLIADDIRLLTRSRNSLKVYTSF